MGYASFGMRGGGFLAVPRTCEKGASHSLLGSMPVDIVRVPIGVSGDTTTAGHTLAAQSNNDGAPRRKQAASEP
jgi:hypothetical protein